MNWHYLTQNRKSVGPVDDEKIAILIASGTVQRNTLVWNDTMEGWANASDTSLMAVFGPPPPPPPPPPPVFAAGFSETHKSEHAPVTTSLAESGGKRRRVLNYIWIVLGVMTGFLLLYQMGMPIGALRGLGLMLFPAFAAWYWKK